MIWYEASLNAGLIDKVEVIKYTTIAADISTAPTQKRQSLCIRRQ